MNKKYLPSALILYLNYFIHGVGCSILGQAVIKEALAASWGVQVMAITAISAALGLGRLIALPFAGPLSDKLGRRISTAIGSGSYAIYLIGLALAFNAGTHGGYQIAYICAIIGGIANSLLDTGIYPAVSEIIYKAPGHSSNPSHPCFFSSTTTMADRQDAREGEATRMRPCLPCGGRALLDRE